MYSCRACSVTTFTVDEMKKEKSLIPSKKGICKCCATEYERNRQMIRKASSKPEDYLSCDDCDRVFSKKHTGNYTGNNQSIKRNSQRFVLRTNCPFCKSENIDNF